MKKILPIGILSGIVMLIVGQLLGMLFNVIDPTLKTIYENETVFRAWDDPLMSLFFLYPIVLGIVLAWIWSHTKQLFKSKNPWETGLQFGFIFFLLAIPSLIINYSSFQIPFLMAFSWTIMSGAQGIVAGAIYAKWYK